MTKFIYITRKVFAIIFLILLVSISVFSQDKKDETNNTTNTALVIENKFMLPIFSYHNESLPLVTLSNFNVISTRTFKNEKEKQAYIKLKRDVRKAYPYAILASVKLREYDAILADMPQKKHSKYLKKIEKELKMQFEEDLKKLTINQGRILIRLIYRETGMTTYKVIRDYRGLFSAIVWQSFGLLFGNNLKWKYDPTKDEDLLIEEFIHQIEDGEV